MVATPNYPSISVWKYFGFYTINGILNKSKLLTDIATAMAFLYNKKSTDSPASKTPDTGIGGTTYTIGTTVVI